MTLAQELADELERLIESFERKGKKLEPTKLDFYRGLINRLRQNEIERALDYVQRERQLVEVGAGIKEIAIVDKFIAVLKGIKEKETRSSGLLDRIFSVDGKNRTLRRIFEVTLYIAEIVKSSSSHDDLSAKSSEFMARIEQEQPKALPLVRASFYIVDFIHNELVKECNDVNLAFSQLKNAAELFLAQAGMEDKKIGILTSDVGTEFDFDVGVAERQGRRPSMEDANYYEKNFAGREGWFFGGVYDGHGGDEGAKIAAQDLYEIFKEQLVKKDVTNSFIEAYIKTSDRIKEVTRSGTTAANVFIDGKWLSIAHAGDSRVIVCTNNKVEFVTTDHNSQNLSEYKRVLDQDISFTTEGYMLSSDEEGNIIMLMVTRALGDKGIRGVSNTPEINSVSLSELVKKGTIRIIICCDGVFDHNAVSVEETAAIVSSIENSQSAAETLVNKAYERGSTDNITVMVVRLIPKERVETIVSQEREPLTIKKTERLVEPQIMAGSQAAPVTDSEVQSLIEKLKSNFEEIHASLSDFGAEYDKALTPIDLAPSTLAVEINNIISQFSKDWKYFQEQYQGKQAVEQFIDYTILKRGGSEAITQIFRLWRLIMDYYPHLQQYSVFNSLFQEGTRFCTSVDTLFNTLQALGIEFHYKLKFFEKPPSDINFEVLYSPPLMQNLADENNYSILRTIAASDWNKYNETVADVSLLGCTSNKFQKLNCQSNIYLWWA